MGDVLAFTFKGGRKRTITIAPTAGNVVTNLTPTEGYRWQVLRDRIIVIPDATVVNRYLDRQTTDGTNLTEGIASTNAITASVTHISSMGEGVIVTTAALGDNSYVGVQNLHVDGVDQYRITLRAGVAGDSYSGYVDVLEIRL